MKHLKTYETLNIEDVPNRGDYVLYKSSDTYGIIKVDNVDWVKGIIYFTTVGKRVYSEQMPFDAYEENIERLYVGRDLSKAEDILRKQKIANRFDL